MVHDHDDAMPEAGKDTPDQEKKIHAKYVLELLHEVRKLLKSMPNVVHVNTDIAQEITVCGDLHGSLDDLFVILHKNGLPSPDNPYIFNGDFVDRGNYSVEIACVLFVCMLLHPYEIIVNRGNHEDHVMNLRYGFIKEVMQKYKGHASKVIRLFQDIFSWLPLATVINKKVLVCHGGISSGTDMAILRDINRHNFESVLQPPLFYSSADELDVREWKQILDILWSDPCAKPGCFPNTYRGGGSYFGPDITKTILERHKFDLLIRSHQCKPDGYEYTHDGKVLTIFSASNYYEVGSNKGAYAKLSSKNKVRIVQFVANKKQGRKLTIKQRVKIVEESAISSLKSKIYGNKSTLMAEFIKGILRLTDWCNIMQSTLQIDLPWRSICPKVATITKDGLVEYNSIFEDLKMRNKISGEDIENHEQSSMAETVYRNKENLETIFRAMDKDNSGQICMSEFEEACQILCRHTGSLLSREHIVGMARNMDKNKDGYIDFAEFLEAFCIVDKFGKELIARRESVDNVSDEPESKVRRLSQGDLRSHLGSYTIT
ncbi:hypothetical protein CAPTEDRAFT_207038 [Capitella teleta]|uniref:Serine/threonine-protein phosphatase n=1 Tax=Capitella teleta TaxID=283909 RepID=R7UQZ4_CAPTE|nr:hypothetical protein CAPTEDRAFT_207038 [Capitella teleta]|eukprot:ELU08959.1 hypothetical protein CAPTEDRAFT_207038 [Capitella teleta]